VDLICVNSGSLLALFSKPACWRQMDDAAAGCGHYSGSRLPQSTVTS
jgi:hypothetical protein